MSELWAPTAEQMMSAMMVALADDVPTYVDAAFIHAPPVRDDLLDIALLQQHADLARKRAFGHLVLNQYVAGAWLPILKTYGLCEPMVVVMPRALHTGEESNALNALCRERGWRSVSITSHPHHQLRCMLTHVATLQQSSYRVLIYSRPGPSIPHDYLMHKPVTTGNHYAFSGDMLVHVHEEHRRIILYANPGPHMPHARIEELLDYVTWRQSHRSPDRD